MKRRSWSEADLRKAVQVSFSFRNVLKELGLVPAGGNYEQIKNCVADLRLSVSHFKGHAWNKGLKGLSFPREPLEDVLKKGSRIQSFKLKKRLFFSGLKKPKCELCGWDKMNADGYRPLELDHINGDHSDNRLENLRILCPNCHSLQPTHRGRNKKRR